MLDFKSWLIETKINFTKDDVLKLAGEHKYAAMWIDINGNVHLDYQDGRQPKAQQIKLNYNDNTIQLRHIVGVHVYPRVQQLLKDLIKKGIIDSSWKIKGDSVGGYVDRQWTNIPGDIETKTVGDLAQQSSRFTSQTEDLVFYHGTSEKDWESIQKTGLHPLGSSYVSAPGYESRGKYEDNKNLIYLATTLDGAWGYAKTKASSVMMKTMPKQYELEKYGSDCDRTIKPIVLRVRIPEISKLRADDDAVNGIMRKWADKIWDKKPKEEQQRIIKELSKKKGFDVSPFPAFIWRETDDGFAEILNKVPKSAWKAWMASIRRFDQVGYEGNIPPRFIEPIKVC